MISLAESAVSLAAGSLTTLSPCVLPLLPLVLGGALQKNKFAPLWMGAGKVTAFTLFGLFLGLLGERLSLNPDHIRKAGAVCLLLMGVALCVPAWTARVNQALSPILGAVASRANQGAAGLDGASAKSAFLLGALLGMVWSPCSGPLLASVLALLASDANPARGAVLLGLFGLGAAIPLVTLAYASKAAFQRVRGAAMQRMGAIKQTFGVLLVILGLAILTGADKWLEAKIVDALPDAWLRLTVLF